MRKTNRLQPLKVSSLNDPGRYADGGGLYLQVSKVDPEQDHVTKAWLFRYMKDGRARQMGLGDVNTFTLKEARERARGVRQQLADGIDPIDARKAARDAARAQSAKAITFKEAAERYIKAHRPGWKNPKHADQWTATLEAYAYPAFGAIRVAEIDTGLVLKAIEPIWTEKTETASRVRGRIEAVLDWATAREYRPKDSPNPARWKGHLDKLLPAKAKVARVRHMPAMPYDELPGFMARLRGMDSISARALELTILTAARTGETIGAKWHEIDLDAKIWTVPGDRTKSGREHQVPLSDRAVEILRALHRERDNPHLFPGARAGKALSNMAMLELLRGMDGTAGLTVHGFRSSFRDWAGDRTNFPREVAEAALAHTLKDKSEASYRRATAIDKRRRLMNEWSRYCASPSRPAGKVFALHQATA